MGTGGMTLRILSLLRAYKRSALFLITLVFLATIFDIAVPFMVQRLIDRLLDFLRHGGGDPTLLLIWLSGGILIATILSYGLRSLYDYNLFTTVTQFEDSIRKQAFESYLLLHVLFHHKSSSGQIIGRLERGASAIYAVLHDVFGHNLLPPSIVFVGVLITLFLKDPWIALVVFLPLPIYIFCVQKIANRIYEIEKQVNEQFELVSKESYDVAGNILTVKKFSQESAEAKHHSELLAEARRIQYSAERLWKIIENVQTLIATIGRISVILLGGFFVVRGISTIGEFVLYVTLQNMAYSPLQQLSIAFPRLRRNAARVERLFSILDERPQIKNKTNAQDLPVHNKDVEFKNVWFRYGREQRWALKRINVVIRAGSRVALVGRSGSGKTTFINLLLRSYDPSQGEILVDGYNLKDIKHKSLLDQIAVVPQEVDLFSRTIFENISYGKPGVRKEGVVRAAKTALAHDFIMRTEMGYDTIVGERGIRLSGGERQRIGIARAVLRDPRILILDEASSHLDTESERLIAQAIQALIKDRTTIVIAHRLSTVLGADMIVVFQEGEIEASGKHTELLKKSSTYRRLYALQFVDHGSE